MRFKKIKKTKEDKTFIEYQAQNQKGGWDDFSFTCSDEPKPEFKGALAALAEDVIDICELPDEYLSRISVCGVSFSYGGEQEVMGATIIAQMRLTNSNGSLNLITAHKPSAPYAEGADKHNVLREECVQRLETLCQNAQEYVNGIRAQGNLFSKKMQA
jgi:hypothetical protein